MNDYFFTIKPLTKEDGGGFLIEYPDLPGCMSDGNTIEETVLNGKDALKCWIEAARSTGREIPKPSGNKLPSGKWVQRVPKSLHARLITKAEREGTSLNMLVTSLIASGLGVNQDQKH